MEASLPVPTTRLARPATSLLSVAMHVGLLTGAIVAGRSVTFPSADANAFDPRIIFVEPAPIPSAPVQRPAPARQDPRPVQPPAVSAAIPIALPTMPAVVVSGSDPDPVGGTGVHGPLGAVPVPMPSGAAPGASGAPYGADRVDQEVRLLGTLAVEYPAGLRRLGVTGRVEVEFVVDATGRVEPETIRWIMGAGSGFDRGVRVALLAARFAPARVRGVAVRQLVRQAFAFRLDR